MIDRAEVVLRTGVARRWPGTVALFATADESLDAENATDVAALVERDGLVDVVARGAGVVRVEERALTAGPLPAGTRRIELAVGDDASGVVELPATYGEVVNLADPQPVTQTAPLAVVAPGAAQTAEGEAVLVEGIECGRGHFNDPRAAYCVACGISMVQRTHNPVRRPRPTLGFVVFDDGATYALDRCYVVGRAPVERDEPGWALLLLDDPDATVSATHGELRLVDWDVEVADLGSTNGTFVWSTVDGAWVAVPEGAALRLAPGATVAFGHRTFVFESVNRTSKRSSRE